MFKSLLCLLMIKFVISTTSQVYSAFTSTTFSTTEGWSVIGGSPAYETRGGQSIFGGANAFGAGVTIYKQILIPDPHHTLRMKIKFWVVNTWENEYIYIKVNGVMIDKQLVNSGTKAGFSQFLYQEIIFFHSSRSIILELTSSLNEAASNEAWGVRDIVIYAYLCPIGCFFCNYTDTATTDCPAYNKVITNFDVDKFYKNEGWLVSNLPVSQNFCDQISTFGKYPTGTTLTKNYFLNPHYEMRVTFQFWKIDPLSTTKYKFYIDNKQVWVYDSNLAQQISICGSNIISEQYVNVDFTIDHNNQLPVFFFSSDLVTPTDYFGFREFVIYTKSCDSTCAVCQPGNEGKTCSTDTAITFQNVESDLTTTTFASAPNWVRYQPNSANSYVKSPQIAGTYYSGMNFLGLFDVLFKDFTLQSHTKIKIRFKSYSSDASSAIQLKIDGVVSNTFSIGYTYTANTCSSNLASRFEEYVQQEYIIDHVSTLLRISFSSTVYSATKYQGFNSFELYSLKYDCSTTPCTEISSVVDFDFQLNTFTDTENWQLIASQSISVTTCDGQSILGGVGILNNQIFMQKRVQLTTHSIIRLQLSIYFLEKWQSTKYLQILADGIEIWKQNVAYSTNLQNLCSSNASYQDQIVDIDIFFNHVNIILDLQFYILNGDGTEYFAIRDYILTKY